MANTIRIKRRAGGGSSGAPASLENAELAFTEVDDVLYYGKGTGGAGGSATTVIAIGGSGAFATLGTNQTISGNKTFSGTVSLGSSATATTQTSGNNSTSVATTAYVDGLLGTATSIESIQDIVGGMVSSNTESGIAVSYDDTNGKLDFDVNDPTITIAGDVDGSATMTNLGNTTITVTLDTVNSNVGSYGSTTEIPVVTVNGKGLVTAVSTASISTTLTVGADTGTADAVALATDTLQFSGGEGIDTAVTNNTITISAEDASTSNKGVASFNSDSFSVTSGAVSIKSGGVSNAQLANSTITLGSSTLTLGSTTTSIAGVTELTVDNINFNGNTISSTDSNGDLILSPNGTGSVDVSNSRIIGLAEPVNGTDATTKNYVDNAITGLDWKSSVNLLASSNVALTGSTNTLVIDGHAALDSSDNNVYRLLLIGQTTGSQNGIYTYTDDGTNYTLVRSTDADTYQELINSSVFVTEGTTYGNTGWVQTNHYLTSFSSQSWSQFSGAGAYSAGAGLGQTGTEFFVNVAADGGIEIVSDALQLKSGVAGNGLTYTTGVLAVGGTADRITVGSDSVDIASTYVGQNSITTVGTIANGTWQGSVVGSTYGGTGVNNGSSTITLGGNLVTSGANALTLTTTGTTNVTLPTTGTLATLAGSETLTNKTINASNIGVSNPGTGAFTTLTASGATTLTAATASTSYTTGTLVVTGGVGISGALYGNSSVLDGFTIDGGTF
jgi:hypothetical protein